MGMSTDIFLKLKKKRKVYEKGKFSTNHLLCEYYLGKNETTKNVSAFSISQGLWQSFCAAALYFENRSREEPGKYRWPRVHNG